MLRSFILINFLVQYRELHRSSFTPNWKNMISQLIQHFSLTLHLEIIYYIADNPCSPIAVSSTAVHFLTTSSIKPATISSFILYTNNKALINIIKQIIRYLPDPENLTFQLPFHMGNSNKINIKTPN